MAGLGRGHSHTERFSGRVQAYLAYRPRFPRGILPFLREHGALSPDAVVADIGAGTGMLAEIFLEGGHCVIAVEPNAEMLEACRELAAQQPKLEVAEGSAEATTLPDASIDLIAVGRAMHWFDWTRAHREFARILRPGGWVLLATSGHRDSGAPVSIRLSEILRQWRMDSAEADTTRDFNQRLEGFLDSSSWHRTTLHHSMTVDFATLLGYAESLSAIPRPGERGYDGMVAELRDVFEEYQRDGEFVTPLSSDLHLGRLRANFLAASNNAGTR
ncbi:MAG TPA: methyltransferase domain-containing protein [Acidobacteriaceae bacterium]